jgi:hypothetical protein
VLAPSSATAQCVPEASDCTSKVWGILRVVGYVEFIVDGQHITNGFQVELHSLASVLEQTVCYRTRFSRRDVDTLVHVVCLQPIARCTMPWYSIRLFPEYNVMQAWKTHRAQPGARGCSSKYKATGRACKRGTRSLAIGFKLTKFQISHCTTNLAFSQVTDAPPLAR